MLSNATIHSVRRSSFSSLFNVRREARRGGWVPFLDGVARACFAIKLEKNSSAKTNKVFRPEMNRSFLPWKCRVSLVSTIFFSFTLGTPNWSCTCCGGSSNNSKTQHPIRSFTYQDPKQFGSSTSQDPKRNQFSHAD
jgi:hypothetical protein